MRWLLAILITTALFSGCSKEDHKNGNPTAPQAQKPNPTPTPVGNQADWEFRQVDPTQYRIKSILLDLATVEKSPMDNGWGLFQDEGYGRMVYEDHERGTLLRLLSKELGHSGKFILGDFPYAEQRNPNDLAFKAEGFDILTMDVKNNSPQHTPFQIIAVVELNNRGMQIVFHSLDGAAFTTKGSRQFFLGTDLNDGEWHSLTIDLAGYIDRLTPGEEIQLVNGIRFVTEDLLVNNMKLTMLEANE